MCFFLGHDVVDSHLMHNKKWAFNSKNYEGLNTYLNDLTLQTNLFLGENFKIQSIEVGLNLFLAWLLPVAVKRLHVGIKKHPVGLDRLHVGF